MINMLGIILWEPINARQFYCITILGKFMLLIFFKKYIDV